MVMGRQLSCLLTRLLAVLYDVTGAIELVGPSRRFSNFLLIGLLETAARAIW
jgi:hypothetical protein